MNNVSTSSKAVSAVETKRPDAGRFDPANTRPLGIKSRTTVSLVLPMFNEAPCVDQTLTTALRVLDENFTDFEIIVADDASTDDSPARVAKWASRDSRIRLVRLARNERFGGALRAGLSAAQNEFLVYTDFDLQIGLNCLPLLVNESKNADVLTGYAEGCEKHANWRSKMVSKTYNFLVRTLFDLRLRDINFGLKALPKAVWDQLDLCSRSPFVDAELFVQVKRLGFTIREVAVPFSLRTVGSSHMRRWDIIARTLWDMARCWIAPQSIREPSSSTVARPNPLIIP
jgi:glycosyltransferase involved in cell wall biosynthesis